MKRLYSKSAKIRFTRCLYWHVCEIFLQFVICEGQHDLLKGVNFDFDLSPLNLNLSRIINFLPLFLSALENFKYILYEFSPVLLSDVRLKKLRAQSIISHRNRRFVLNIGFWWVVIYGIWILTRYICGRHLQFEACEAVLVWKAQSFFIPVWLKNQLTSKYGVLPVHRYFAA